MPPHDHELLQPEHGSLKPAKAAEETLLGQAGTVKFVRDSAIKSGNNSTVAMQVGFVLALQQALSGRVKDQEGDLTATKAGTLLAAMLQQLYSHDLDVIDEDAILAWWADRRAAEGETMTGVKAPCKGLVEWLEEADEDSDEDG